MLPLQWAMIILGVIGLGIVTFNLAFTTSACLLAGPNTNYPTIESAVSAIKPGCTIILLSGSYSTNLVVTKPVRIVASPETVLVSLPPGSASNTTGQPSLAVLSDPQKPVIIRAADPNRPTIEIRANDVELRGLNIQGGSTGISVTKATHTHLMGNVISQSAQAGIALSGTQESLVQGNVITGSGSVGIILQNATKNQLIANRIEQAQQGITLESSSKNIIKANRLNALAGEGIRLDKSVDNILSQNEIRKSQRGLLLTNSPRNTLRGNRLEQNVYGLRVWSDQILDFVEDITPDNTVNGRPILYLVGVRNQRVEVSRRPALVALVNSEKITLEGAAMNALDEGILLVNTSHSLIRSSTLNGTLLGITLIDSRENEIRDNQIMDSAENGISLVHSHGNRLADNIVSSSDKHGIYASQSGGNELVQNTISESKASGIFLEAGQKNRVMDDQLLDNWVGIFLERSEANTVSDNVIKHNRFGLYVNGSGANAIKGNRLEGNQTDSNVTLPPESPPPTPPNNGNGPSEAPVSGGS